MANLLIAHGGGPTAVINASLAGAIEQARKAGFTGKILAPRFGSTGLLNEDFIDLTDITDTQLKLLKCTPGSAIGTSRHPLEEPEYRKIVQNLNKHDITYVLFTGGNGSMDTIGNIYKYRQGELYCAGIPKTVDNDIAVTDHAPGYASNAKYMARTVFDCAKDVMGLPIHVSVIEAMGRNTGWLTAASALARTHDSVAPHILCFPEIPFDDNKFLSDVEKARKQYGGVIVVASEGLKYADGTPIVPPTLTVGRATYFGDVSAHLATLIQKNLGIKARSEKPGLIGRCCSELTSSVDVQEAVLMGATACQAVLDKQNGVMAGLERISTKPYVVRPILIPIEQVMLTEKTMPREFINKEGNDVTKAFIEWARPLVGKMPKQFSYMK